MNVLQYNATSNTNMGFLQIILKKIEHILWMWIKKIEIYII
jgi:hypothetical protein